MAESQNTKAFYNTEIPSDWEVVKSGEVIKYFGGNAFSSDDACQSGIKWLKIANVGIETTKWDEASYLPEEFIITNKKYLLQEGDVVMALTRPILDSKLKIAKIKKEDTPCLLNQRVAKLITQKNLDNFYAYHVIQMPYFINRMNVAMAGTDPPNLGSGDLEKIKIPLPPIPEQRAIAKVLGKMDEAINANNQLIAQKELRKKWLMQNLLTGKKRLKGFSGEWKEYSLGEMFAERNERNTDKLPLLSIGQNGVYPQGESIKKDNSNTDKSKYKKICVGDIGYNTMRMWQGRSALSTLEGIVSPAYTILKPKKAADALFFSYLFRTPKMVNLFWRNSQGLVGDTLNCKYKDFSIIRARLPLKEEQIVIAQILQAADIEISLLTAKTDKLKEQKKGMMEVLLTGKKRLKID